MSASPSVAHDRAPETISSLQAEFCRAAQGLYLLALEGRIGFVNALKSLLDVLRRIRRNGYEVDAADVSAVQSVAQGSSSALTPLERELLVDSIAFIEFAFRNGLSFGSINAVLGHDVAQIASYDWNLERAKSDGFLPKAHRWSQVDIGESAEGGE